MPTATAAEEEKEKKKKRHRKKRHAKKVSTKKGGAAHMWHVPVAEGSAPPSETRSGTFAHVRRRERDKIGVSVKTKVEGAHWACGGHWGRALGCRLLAHVQKGCQGVEASHGRKHKGACMPTGMSYTI